MLPRVLAKCEMNLEKIGRTRMALRLPAYRQLLAGVRSTSLSEIFVAYAEAAIHLDTLRRSDCPELGQIVEYEQLCREMELSIEPYLRMFPPHVASKG